MKTGIEWMAEERKKQLEKYGLDHDKQHASGELALIAAVMIMGCRDVWGLSDKHPDRKEQLIIAGTLIAAEIDRLQGL